MKRNHIRTASLIVLVVGLTAHPYSVFAAETEIEQVMRERHEKFEHMGEVFEKIDREIKRESPDIKLIQRHSAQIDEWARDQIHWFPKGSGPESGIKTEAKPEIWSMPDEFGALQNAFGVEAGMLKRVAIKGDPAGLVAQIEATGAVCSKCHETYRKKFSLFSIFGF
jgi:cytochrome c556